MNQVHLAGGSWSCIEMSRLTLVILFFCISDCQVRAEKYEKAKSADKAYATKEIPVEEAIKVLQVLGREIRTVQYRVEYTTGFFDDLADLNKFRPARIPGAQGQSVGPPKVTLSAVHDYEQGRYFYRLEEIQAGGVAAPRRQMLAFDGREYRFLGESIVEKTAQGERLKALAQNGEVSLSKPVSPSTFFEILSAFTPNEAYIGESAKSGGMWVAKPLSQWLAEKKESEQLLSIQEPEPGIWRIRWRHSDPKQPKAKVIVESLCNVLQGGIVTHKAYWYHYPDGTARVSREELKELTKLGRYWIPKVRVFVLRYRKGILGPDEVMWGDRWIYTDVQVNQPVTDELFRPDFPKGTQVVDRIRNEIYLVGDRFEEREAVRRFMQEQGLAAPPETARRWSWWWWVGGIGLLVILLGLLLAWRWRRRRLLGTSSTSAP